MNIDIKPIYVDGGKDSYKFKIDDTIILEFTGDAITVLEITPSSSSVDEDYKMIMEQFDIERMIKDLLTKKDKIKEIVISSKICCVDGKFFIEIDKLKKYKKNF